MFLCTCLNCDGIFVDNNPSEDSIDYHDESLEEIELGELIFMCDGSYYCQNCGTDGFLANNLIEK
jgi:hypothetical protein